MTQTCANTSESIAIIAHCEPSNQPAFDDNMYTLCFCYKNHFIHKKVTNIGLELSDLRIGKLQKEAGTAYG